MSVEKDPRGAALRNERSIRGLKTQNNACFIATMATCIRMQPSVAPPTVSQYDDWLASAYVRPKPRSTVMTGAKLRRIVVMKQNSCTLKEIGSAIGFNYVSVREWLHRLPRELGGLAA